MSDTARDPRLDALLRDLPPPPVPAGLAARILAAAAAATQEVRPGRARRASSRRDRRGRWLRRPLLAGTAALGLIMTSAVAATLAGLPIPQKIAAVFFPEEKAPAPKQAVAPRRASRPSPVAAPVRSAEAEAMPATDGPAWVRQPNPWRLLFMARRVVEARRAMGLPAPGADRVERQFRRRAELWRAATPEQRARWIERQQARHEARRAALATPEGQAALAEWRAQMRAWRAQRQAGIPLTPEQRAARQELIREWRARYQAAPPLAEEQRGARQQRFRQWREAGRARWLALPGQDEGNMQAGTEGPDAPER